MTLLFAVAIATAALVGLLVAGAAWFKEGDRFVGIVVGVPCLLFLAAAVQAIIVRL